MAVPQASRPREARPSPAPTPPRPSTPTARLSEHPLTVLPTYALPATPRRGVLFANLLTLTAWTIAAVALWLATPVPDGAAPATPLIASAAAQLVAISIIHFTLTTAALLLAVHSRWWRATITLVPQTALLLARHLVLDDVTAWLQFAMTALSAAVLHTAAGAVFAWRWHTTESDRHA